MCSYKLQFHLHSPPINPLRRPLLIQPPPLNSRLVPKWFWNLLFFILNFDHEFLEHRSERQWPELSDFINIRKPTGSFIIHFILLIRKGENLEVGSLQITLTVPLNHIDNITYQCWSKHGCWSIESNWGWLNLINFFILSILSDYPTINL